MDNAYLLITDLHDSDTNIPNRNNYLEEVFYVKMQIKNIADKYVDNGCVVFPIFLGDVFNRSYKSIVACQQSNNFIVGLSEIYGKCYSVVGNHETSFYKNNPFWGLINHVDSQRLEMLDRRVWQPNGIINILNVVDLIQDGEVNIYFNHYGTGVAETEKGKVNIGLFHSDYLYRGITTYIKETEGIDLWDNNIIYLDDTELLDGYDYAFFGHLHDIYGKWDWLNEVTNHLTKLYHLASLGRPKHTEVRDNFLERNLPVILVKDGKFSGIEDNKITLPSREQCVKEEVVIKQQEGREKLKAKKELVDYYPTLDNPIQNIRNRLESISEAELGLFDMLTDSNNSVESDILNKYYKIRGDFYGR